MNITLQPPKLTDLRPRLTVIGVGGAGGNAVNNMIASALQGVEFVVANTDAQALVTSSAEHRVQLGINLTEGLGAGSKPEIGEAAAEEAIDEIRSQISGSHMVFIAAGMGGGTGTGAASVIARTARELGVLAVGVVTKPFQFEGARRQRIAEAGIAELKKHVDTLIVIPNQNLFRIANAKTTFAEAFVMADQVLYSGIACIVDLIVKEGLINLDFADVRTVMSGMGTAMMGTGEAEGERRAILAAEEAICNPLLDDVTLKGAKGLLLSIIGGRSLTLFEVDEAASRVRKEVDPDANIIVGATFDESLGERLRVSIVASGMTRQSEQAAQQQAALAPAFPQPQSQQFQAPQPGARPLAPAPLDRQPRADHPPPTDFDRLTRMLTEAIDPAANAGSQQQRQLEAWQGPGDVSVRPARPTLGSTTLPPPLPPEGRLPRPVERGFLPGAPQDFALGQPRMPALEDFPPIGQHEYRVKSGQLASGPQPHTPPRVYSPPHQQQPARRGLLERLGFVRRSERFEQAYPAAQRRVADPAGQDLPYDAERQAHSDSRTANSRTSELNELPEFFGNRRVR